MAAVVTYLRLLQVPEPRNIHAVQMQNGKKIFSKIDLRTVIAQSLRQANSQHYLNLRSNISHPYSDLLVYDLGEGLADHRPDFQASGQEWRTAPLWGIGLVEDINEHSNFLHDGRARNIREAILWYKGEAIISKQSYAELSRQNRNALLKFLQSL